MKLTLDGIKDRAAWEAAGIALPDYDPAVLQEAAARDPRWVHMGVGNIFRLFIGGIANQLISQGDLSAGITCVETFDEEIVDKIYRPFDNLVLAVTLHNDGTREKKVLGSLGEAVKGDPGLPEEWKRLKEIFRNPGLQMVSFTITEKGYALTGADGSYFSFIRDEIEQGPEKAGSAIAVTAAMLLERYKAGRYPLALVSMDNCSSNGERLRKAVLTIVSEWIQRGYADQDFLTYVSDEDLVAFPWSMIDKITPRPSEEVGKELAQLGVEDMDVVITSRKTYIAPFVNAEGPQYLVVEDHFPAGRPPLEKAGVYMTDRATVHKSERMKVTVCLNPIHTALCTFDCMLGYELFADGMHDPQLKKLAERVGLVEGMDVVEDPGILSPRDFIKEVIEVRFPNPYLGDTSQRIAVDISQMVGIRFGETIKAYVNRYGSAEKLTGLPLAIAGWLRYLLQVDDNGNIFELAPDPMIPQLQARLAGIEAGRPESLQDQLRPILSNAHIFGSNLYAAGIGEKIEEMVRDMLAGPGAVRRTLKKYLD